MFKKIVPRVPRSSAKTTKCKLGAKQRTTPKQGFLGRSYGKGAF